MALSAKLSAAALLCALSLLASSSVATATVFKKHPPPSIKISGTFVYHKHPVAGAVCYAYAVVHHGKDQLLGKDTTDHEGEYSITYTPDAKHYRHPHQTKTPLTVYVVCHYTLKAHHSKRHATTFTVKSKEFSVYPGHAVKIDFEY